ncbi:hypothetical protein Scep_003859 [Stephania cephalantha]|uniref:Uncharacterized protein n=1 Tax=Stephania cephalantha TaxID=152367 RepID=A0AAP0PW55_9MAGN
MEARDGRRRRRGRGSGGGEGEEQEAAEEERERSRMRRRRRRARAGGDGRGEGGAANEGKGAANVVEEGGENEAEAGEAVVRPVRTAPHRAQRRLRRLTPQRGVAERSD